MLFYIILNKTSSFLKHAYNTLHKYLQLNYLKNLRWVKYNGLNNHCSILIVSVKNNYVQQLFKTQAIRHSQYVYGGAFQKAPTSDLK